MHCACHGKGRRGTSGGHARRDSSRRFCVLLLQKGPAATTRAVTLPGGFVYSACHAKGSCGPSGDHARRFFVIVFPSLSLILFLYSFLAHLLPPSAFRPHFDPDGPCLSRTVTNPGGIKVKNNFTFFLRINAEDCFVVAWFLLACCLPVCLALPFPILPLFLRLPLFFALFGWLACWRFAVQLLAGWLPCCLILPALVFAGT